MRHRDRCDVLPVPPTFLSRVADLLVARPPRASVGQARDGQARQEQAGAASSNVRT
jgi:hypothetical protein